MGLDTTHDCFSGPYSQFMRWREWLCEKAQLPPLMLMEGYFNRGDYNDPFSELHKQFAATAETYYRCLPIRWESLKEDPYLHELLYHSDCDGEIPWESCAPMADRLEQLIEGVPDDRKMGIDPRGIYDGMVPATKRFIAGLRAAAEAKEAVEFG